jgi:predicted nucleotide-binding protein
VAKEKVQARSSENPKGKAPRKPRATTLYPKYSLVDALKIAESIRDNNASLPYNRVDLAISLGTTPQSSSFRILITASAKYGLTVGSYQAEYIDLTDLGRSVTTPTSDDEKSDGLLTALYRVDFYKSFFSKFRNHRLPRKNLLLNTLEREFDIPKADREQCHELLMKNASELGLLKDVAGTLYVRFDQPHMSPSVNGGDGSISDTEATTPEADVQGIAPPDVTPAKQDQVVDSSSSAATTHRPRIFISHSKNRKILEQIKSNLEFGGFSYNVAIETETTAIPIPEKIFGMMRDCNCAIVNVSADETEKREDGSFGINANVLVEIGAAFLAYNQRVILLVDKRLSLPSNLQGLYRCEYQGDELDSGAVTKLQKGLLQFRVPVD